MDNIERRDFYINQKFAKSKKKEIWLFLLGIASGIAILVRECQCLTFSKSLEMSLFIVAFVGMLLLRIWQVKHFSRMAVSIDTDGLWPFSQPKQLSLIRWERVSKLKDRPFLQQLDIFDPSGKLLLSLSYQLNDFTELRNYIIKRIRLPQNLPWNSVSFTKPLFIQLVISVGLIVAFPLFLTKYTDIGYRFDAFDLYKIIIPIIIPVSLYRFVKSAYKITISKDYLILIYPWREQRIARSEVYSIEINNAFQNVHEMISYNKIAPEVRIYIGNEKHPIKLIGFKEKPVDIYNALSSWKNC